MEQFFFNDWQGLLRTLVVGVLAYITLVLFLRFSGKRTLSKMNAFDLVMTVALGSTLATVLLTESVALAEGALAFALLIGLQFVVTLVQRPSALGTATRDWGTGDAAPPWRVLTVGPSASSRYTG